MKGCIWVSFDARFLWPAHKTICLCEGGKKRELLRGESSTGSYRWKTCRKVSFRSAEYYALLWWAKINFFMIHNAKIKIRKSLQACSYLENVRIFCFSSQSEWFYINKQQLFQSHLYLPLSSERSVHYTTRNKNSKQNSKHFKLIKSLYLKPFSDVWLVFKVTLTDRRFNWKRNQRTRPSQVL